MEQLELPYSDEAPEQEARAGFQPIRSRISDRAWQCVLRHLDQQKKEAVNG